MKRAILLALTLISSTAFAEDDPVAITITDAERTAVAAAGNDFTADLYSQLREQKGNIFFSPQSIMDALTMTLAGARGETADEMQAALRLHLKRDYIPPTFADLSKSRNEHTAKGGYKLQEANAIWVQQNFALQPDYVSLLSDSFGAQATNVDFQKDPELAAKAINDWVESKTQNTIHNLVTTDALGPATRLVLTNAIYFKANWLDAFKKGDTKQEEFFLNPGQSATAAMMHQLCKSCRYAENDRYQTLSLPYTGGDLEMVVILPRDKNGIDALEQSLSPQELKQAMEALVIEQEVNVALPKFRAEYMTELGATLRKMGMNAAFNGDIADFSGITGKKELFISEVIHKAFVDVDETGTEASAATAVIMMPTSAMISEPKNFTADHPFIYLIRDTHNGIIYFIGRMVNP